MVEERIRRDLAILSCLLYISKAIAQASLLKISRFFLFCLIPPALRFLNIYPKYDTKIFFPFRFSFHNFEKKKLLKIW